MDQLNNLCLYELKRIARELKTKGRSKMGRMDLINEFKKYKEEEIIDLIEKVTTTSDYICIHGKIKYFCKECGGSQICKHDRIKYACKKCKGSLYCMHNKQKQKCKECGGSQICIHNKQQQQCKECGGSQICEHMKQKASCKECRIKLIYDLRIRKNCK